MRLGSAGRGNNPGMTTLNTCTATVAPFRCVIDTNILNKIAEGTRLVGRVRDLTDQGKLDLIVTSVTE